MRQAEAHAIEGKQKCLVLSGSLTLQSALEDLDSTVREAPTPTLARLPTATVLYPLINMLLGSNPRYLKSISEYVRHATVHGKLAAKSISSAQAESHSIVEHG